MSEKSIYTFAKWKVKDGNLEMVLSLLSQVAVKSIEEEGNLFYKIHQNNSDTNMLILFEGYKDESALTEHRNSEYFQKIVVEKIAPLLENREVILATELIL